MPRVKKEAAVKAERTLPAKKKPLSKKVEKDVVLQTVAVEKAPKATRKKGGLTIDVFDIAGKVVETVTLPEAIFGAKVNKQLIAQAIRVYLANQRSGTASTKTRGEVAGSTRKIYRQKGTGRARHGGIRAPIFVHGGIAFGPKPRDYSLSLPKKMKKAALIASLSAKLKEEGIKIVSGLEKVAPKTKDMAVVLQQFGVGKKNGSILLVLPDNAKEKLTHVQRAARNIPGVHILAAPYLNTFAVYSHKVVLFMQPALATLEKHVVEEK